MADAILISIQPEYAEKILSGEKTFEFRRRTAQRPVGLMVIYASAPISAVVGYAQVDDILSLPLTKLWKRTRKGAGTDLKHFHEYFHGRDDGNAYVLSQSVRLDTPIPLSSLGIASPPQDFMYLDAGIADRLLQQEDR